jgi:glycosyltransferase involved in cell wall biosynthesis
LRVPKGIIFTAPDAVDNDFFARTAQAVRKERPVYREALKLPERYFLYVGRLVRAKGVFDLLEAYAALAPDLRSEVGLVLVGNGTAQTALAERAGRIHPGSVYFAGFAQREGLAAFFALADILVFPTHSDPWGLVVNEAMACGLAVISTTVAGCTADLVQDQWNGCVVSPHNIGELASAMNLLARNSDLRLRMAANSRERILQYSPQACAEGLAGAAIAVGQRMRHG